MIFKMLFLFRKQKVQVRSTPYTQCCNEINNPTVIQSVFFHFFFSSNEVKSSFIHSSGKFPSFQICCLFIRTRFCFYKTCTVTLLQLHSQKQYQGRTMIEYKQKYSYALSHTCVTRIHKNDVISWERLYCKTNRTATAW